MRRRNRQTYVQPTYREEINRLSIDQVGMTMPARWVIFLLSLLPLVGLIMGGYYSAQAHRQTRAFGRTVMGFSFILHIVYACFVCPALLYFSLSGVL